MTWKPLPPTSKAAEVWLEFIDDDQTKYFFLEGAVRSSKTFASIIAWCDWVENVAPPGPLMMLGNTRETLIQNVIYPLVELVGPQYAILNRGTSTLRLFGRDIFLFGAANISAMRRLQGKGAVGAYCDEAPTYPKDVWQMLGTRAAADGIKIIATMNPESSLHWMKTEYLDRLDEVNGRSWHFELDDNPFLSEKVKQELRGQYRGLFKQRYIDGLWVLAEGLIYDIDIGSPKSPGPNGTWKLPKQFSRTMVGVDCGISHPFAILAEGWGPDEKRWIAYDEHVHDINDPQRPARPKTHEELADDLADFVEDMDPLPDSIEVSPDDAGFRLQAKKTFRERGIKIPIRNALNAVIPGIQNVARDLGRGRLVFYVPGVPRTLKGCSNYTWDPKATERGEDAPLKKNDDECLIGSTLVETINGPVKIQDIREGDLVLTRAGFKAVAAQKMTSPSADIWEVKFDNGSTLQGTKNHPIMSYRQRYVSMDTLRYGDLVWRLKSSYIGGESTADGQIATNGVIGHTSKITDIWELPTTFTGMYGKIISAPFQMGCKYTTKTATPATTTPETLNSSHPNGIPGCTTKIGPKIRSTLKRSKIISAKFGLWRQSGIGRRKGENGTASMLLSSTSESSRPNQRSASSAARSTKERQLALGFALMLVNLPGGEKKASITRSGSVRYVARPISQTSTLPEGPALSYAKVVSPPKPVGRKEAVYNLTVDGNHEFFANGILVHNCDALRYCHARATRGRAIVTGKPRGL